MRHRGFIEGEKSATASVGISPAIAIVRCSNRLTSPICARRRCLRCEVGSPLEKGRRSRTQGLAEGQRPKSGGHGQTSDRYRPKREETRAFIIKPVTATRNCVATLSGSRLGSGKTGIGPMAYPICSNSARQRGREAAHYTIAPILPFGNLKTWCRTIKGAGTAI